MTQKTTIRIGKFTLIGIILSLFNFLVYTFLARVIMNTNELLWLDSLIAYASATVLAYILHSKSPGKSVILLPAVSLCSFSGTASAPSLSVPF